MNKLTILFITFAICGVYADVSQKFRPLSGRLTTSRFGRQEESVPEQSNGYNYPKPEYGAPAPAEQQAPTRETAEFREPERQAKPETTKVVYIGVPQRQFPFEKLVYHPETNTFDYHPYAAVDIVSVRGNSRKVVEHIDLF